MKNGTQHFRHISDSNLWSSANCTPVYFELRKRRLSWLQTVLKNPNDHVAFSASIFGDVLFDPLPTGFDWSTCLPYKGASPWAFQMLDDLEALRPHFEDLCDDLDG